MLTAAIYPHGMQPNFIHWQQQYSTLILIVKFLKENIIEIIAQNHARSMSK